MSLLEKGAISGKERAGLELGNVVKSTVRQALGTPPQVLSAVAELWLPIQCSQSHSAEAPAAELQQLCDRCFLRKAQEGACVVRRWDRRNSRGWAPCLSFLRTSVSAVPVVL